MRVSIVIPTYERAGFVETAVESVLRQEHADLELLVVDDGSTDGTAAVLERIAERTDPARFRWWRHDNVGQSETINRGFARATGELLGYLSSDDYLLPGAVERLVAAAQEHPDADVVYPWCDVIDPADRTVDTLELLEHTMVDALRWNLCLVASGALVRRRFLERVGGWDPGYPNCPDYEWWLRDPHARFVRVPERLAVWRQHDASLTTAMGSRGRFDDQLRMFDEIFARADLPAEVVAVRDEAYASLFISAGVTLLRADVDDQRFAVFDEVGGRVSRFGRDAEAHSVRHHAERIAGLARQAEQLDRRAANRERTIDAQRRLAEHREVRIAELERQLAELHAASAGAGSSPPSASGPYRPAWLRAGRRLTPPALRHRVGVAVHRLRGSR